MNDLKYIVYARKSEERAERQVASIHDQLSENQKCKETMGLSIAETITDEKSGYHPGKRPGFNRMLDLISKGYANAILTWKPDRLSRNPEEGGKLLQMLQDGNIMEIRTPLGEMYTQESDHLILQIHFGMANQYSRNLSQNVKRGLSYKVKRGEYFGQAPLGYINAGERNSRNIKPDSILGPIIIKVFEEAAKTSVNLVYLADYANKIGLRTRKERRVGKSELHLILTNPLYYGSFRFKGEICKGTYEPLISKELFYKVQLVLQDRSKPRTNSWQSPLNGLIKCGECGSAITTTVKEKHYPRTNRTAKYTYHHCTHRKGFCSQKPIKVGELDKLIFDSFSTISINEELWKLGIELFKQKHISETKNNVDRMQNLQGKYNSLQLRLNRLIELRADNEITKEELAKQKEVILNEQTSIKHFMEDSEGSTKRWLELEENFINTCYQAKNILSAGTLEEKRDLIKAVGENLFLKNGKLDVTLKKPFDVMLQPVKHEEWWACLGSNQGPLQCECSALTS
jgi:site-specific DNA recombinase